jgi:hypothetical protein
MGFLQFKTIKYGGGEEDKYREYLDSVKFFLGYFIAFSIAYYIFSVRQTALYNGELTISDIFLLTVMLFGLFGWLPYGKWKN